MKRIVIYIATLGLLTLAPVKDADIGNLRPVEVVLVCQQDDAVVLSTDTGDVGQGTDALTALENLKATTPGTIYLDTAKYLLFTEDAEGAVQQLKSALKKNCYVCMTDREVDLKTVAKYLSVHGKLPRLKEWKTGEKLPCLRVIEKRFFLTKTS